MEVHEAVADGGRIAARYTPHFRQRGKGLAIEVCFFGHFAPVGRMRRSSMLTRALPTTAGDNAEQTRRPLVGRFIPGAR
ncbi:hypothetical protein [Streptomyces alkaliterrae]|uniref:hypothetical protein n=1 Tax=Streptomyces alkaliterrae TaxID=2213162 RepID=UPI001E4004D8|nr:hypothetical protein [Streptomyces alkaliterrae]